jgi:hypothetical protein
MKFLVQATKSIMTASSPTPMIVELSVHPIRRNDLVKTPSGCNLLFH